MRQRKYTYLESEKLDVIIQFEIVGRNAGPSHVIDAATASHRYKGAIAHELLLTLGLVPPVCRIISHFLTQKQIYSSRSAR